MADAQMRVAVVRRLAYPAVLSDEAVDAIIAYFTPEKVDVAAHLHGLAEHVGKLSSAPPIDASRAEDAWISVEERLPELDTPVLVWFNERVCAFIRADMGYDGWAWAAHHMGRLCDSDSYEWDDDYNGVKFWMPLPGQPARALATDGDDRG